MLIFSRAPLFLWAEAIATACFTQNRSIIHRRFNKTPYELINGRKLDILFFMYSVLSVIPRMIAKILGSLSTTARTVPPAQEPQVRQSSKASTTIADTTPIPTNSSSHVTNIPITSKDVDKLNPNAMVDGNTFVNPFVNSSTKQVIGEPSRPILTRNQLRSDGDMCMYSLSVRTMEPKNVKEAMTDPAWIDSMQEELLQFKRNKSRLVVKGYRQEEGIDFEESFASDDVPSKSKNDMPLRDN
uniref:Retrovirus-related Pol polyprotein from transposon TNT 1-94 n=1 Tax=Tanacetum cinerariifolium TaxID=118510 RepID=A0A6L2NHV9_TANCI|nr:hypothetical protein [Tanacetum cinerariifolium]